jgi:ribosomal protein L7/L12
MNEVELYQRLVELAEKVSAMQEKLDFVMREMSLQYPEAQTHEKDEIRQMLKANRKIEAIKLYRERHDVGLADAKTAVEQIEKELFK